MASVEQLTIQFSGKGAGKLRAQLNTLSKAMNRLAARQVESVNTTKVVNKAAMQLTAQLKSQGLAWKKLGVNVKTLKQAYRGNVTALAKMRRALKKTSKHTRILGGSFAVLRSKMLLFNFAMALGIRQLMNFTKEAAKVESMKRGFTALTGATENSTLALEKLKKATNNTMSEFDLFQQANNAMILGVSNNSDEMAEMFDIAQRLGRVLGRDTKTSVESLITGIGRQSRMMLDNIGIITKVDEANRAYAKVLEKNVSQLTDAEKKQAFLNATMEAAREKVARFAEETKTTQDTLDEFDAAMADLAVNIGEGLGTAFLPLVEVMTLLAKAFNSERVQAYATIIGTTLAGAFLYYIFTLKKAVIWQTRLGWGAVATAAGILASEVLLMSGIFDDNADSMDLSAQKADAYSKALMKMNLANLVKEHMDLTTKLQAYEEILGGINREEAARRGVEPMGNPYEDILITIEEYIKIVEKGFSSFDDFVSKQDDVLTLYKKTPEAQKAVVEANIKMVESMIAVEKAGEANAEKLTNFSAVLAMLEEQLLGMVTKENALRKEILEDVMSTVGEAAQYQIDTARAVADAKIEAVNRTEQIELSALKATWDYKKMSDKQKAAEEAKIAKKAEKARKKVKKETNKEMLTMFRVQQGINIAESVMNTSVAYTTALKQGGFLFGIQMATVVAMLGAAQVAMIAAQKPPKMQYGGLVGGRRHAQGGTMLEAEQGEFVVSRAGVEAAGIETLNRINSAGGGGGGASIVINNPILGKDTIEDEIIPQIKEALRRGGDIGIS